jgi:hypothetical protein
VQIVRAVLGASYRLPADSWSPASYDQIRIGVDLLLRAEQRWPALRAAILSGTTG